MLILSKIFFNNPYRAVQIDHESMVTLKYALFLIKFKQSARFSL
jgi:hypothetical protein